MSTEKITIQSIGSDGDGIGEAGGGPVFVPFTLPGEEVAIARVKNQGTIMSIAKPSEDRVTAVCAHFGPEAEGGACGSCTLQHWASRPYLQYKRQRVVDAMKSRGLACEVGDIIAARPGERRRLSLTGRVTEKGVLLGFSQHSSHHIVNIAECPVATGRIAALLPSIRRIAAALASGAEPFRVTLLDTMSGLDVAFEGAKKLDDKRRRSVIETVLGEKGIARVSLEGEILVEPVKPQLDFDGVTIFPPPGTFIQATMAAEKAMADLVLGHMGKAKKVADLFSGCGTFALRLARKHAVHAVEFEAAALAALELAASKTQGLKPVTIERRDLFRRPMMAMDLKYFDAAVFDPPRAGAETQAHELAKSKVPKIAAVSCNPVTLARDLGILVEGGYKITSVTPIDQFLWTSHVEVVALLERPK